jgi:hypothetical protein
MDLLLFHGAGDHPQRRREQISFRVEPRLSAYFGDCSDIAATFEPGHAEPVCTATAGR